MYIPAVTICTVLVSSHLPASGRIFFCEQITTSSTESVDGRRLFLPPLPLLHIFDHITRGLVYSLSPMIHAINPFLLIIPCNV